MGPLPPPTMDDHLRLLSQVAGRAPAAPDAPFWDDLFSPPAPLSSLPASLLEEGVAGYYEQLGEGGEERGGQRVEGRGGDHHFQW